ncbi:3-oxoacyl-[acyl-carrier-protein] reductase FabG [Roseibaca ekhonensis]|jgi:NAD(P)-dependent dehydrogenase (short-subunit alcohol dehydrogenase family)|uniref:3-oxoacyl-[acyl-carrier-protein] reductase FabG n=1 Tax=Roseinatronobacter ekhonensis TaxID=254356 RepID=A0A3B0MC48_9RHOB|nr:SDR family NAD(P)-dependent oxidoreductase [Roseibaca ekhonensis]SUZ32970.1 3-oxoacyl-[acyl-carrier-protein] reductase FabG [Roseibaca ekhonensis]
MKKVMITGIAGGFGKPTALALLAGGYDVAGSVRSRSGKNAATVAELEAAGAKIVEMDVTEAVSTERGVADAISQLGGLDILFNNAGIGSYGIQELMSPDDMAHVFDVNVMGVQRVMRAALPHLRAQGRGTVLYTSSLIGRIATPFYGTYSASKWALEAIVECYRTELSGFGIESCLIEPGAMPTAFFDGLVTPKDAAREAEYGDFAAVPAMSNAGLAQMLKATPMQRPERIAETVIALLDMPFGEKPFRTVVDHVGVGPEIKRYNDVLHDVTRTVLTNFGIAEMLDLNA